MNKEPTENGFTAKEYNFQGVTGYTVKQWYDGICICSQFISESAFQSFCEEAGISPDMIKITM